MADKTKTGDVLAPSIDLVPPFETVADENQWLYGVHTGDTAATARLTAAANLDTQRIWVRADGYRLSDRLWDARNETRRQIDGAIREGIAVGESAMDMARRVEKYLYPDLRPKRNEKGEIIPGQPKSIATEYPIAYGPGSYPARRLARTEITRSHGQGVENAAAHNRFVTGIKWTLSGSHPELDRCNLNASATDPAIRVAGVYPKGSLPRYPDHPHCLCFLSPYVDRSQIPNVIAQLRDELGLNNAAPSVFKFTPQFDESDPRILAATKSLIAKATAAEPAVTALLRTIGGEIDGELFGLKNRLKTVDSTVPKLAGDANAKGRTIEQAADGLFDNLRYTYELKEDAYSFGVTHAIDALQSEGYRTLRVKNFWDGDGYVGVNAVFETPAGQPFELQFHTARTLDAKDNLSHPLYKRQRKLDRVADAAEWNDLERQIDDVWAAVRADPPAIDGLTANINDRLENVADSGRRRAIANEATGAADRLISKAILEEATVSAQLTTAFESASTLTGADVRFEQFKNRLKTRVSTRRKIIGDVNEKGWSVDKVSENLFDNLRYTAVTNNPATYEEMVFSITDDLIRAGNKQIRAKNFWDGDGYVGINSIFETPNGQYFELQFHTENSITAKPRSHKLFDKQRVLDKEKYAAERAALQDQIDAVWIDVRAEMPPMPDLTAQLKRRSDPDYVPDAIGPKLRGAEIDEIVFAPDATESEFRDFVKTNFGGPDERMTQIRNQINFFEPKLATGEISFGEAIELIESQYGGLVPAKYLRKLGAADIDWAALKTGRRVADRSTFRSARPADVKRSISQYRNANRTLSPKLQQQLTSIEQTMGYGLITPEQAMRGLAHQFPEMTFPKRFTKAVPKSVRDTIKKPFERTFTRSASRDYIENNLNMTIIDATPSGSDIGGVALENIAKTFHDLRRAGYDIPSVIRFSDATSGGALGSYTPSIDQISIHYTADYWSNPRLFQKQQFDRGFLSTPDERHAMTHEYGHYLHSRSLGDVDMMDLAGRPIRPTDYRGAQTISHYALTNQAEFVAETYTKLMMGETVPPDVLASYKKYKGPPVRKFIDD